MKQFLRYQISGSTFIMWLAIFVLGRNQDTFYELAKLMYSELDNMKVVLGIAAALPIGTLIHQISVMMKNWAIGKIWKQFQDIPTEELDSCVSDEISYYRAKTSNLNSFYYVRVDNGLLAPLLALITCSCILGFNTKGYLIFTAAIVALILLIYLIRIGKELSFYREKIESSLTKPCKSCACALDSQ